MKATGDSYSRQMEFRNACSLDAQLRPMAKQLHELTEGQPIRYEHTRAIIESVVHPPQAFTSRGIVEITLGEGQAAVREHRHFDGWKELADEA